MLIYECRCDEKLRVKSEGSTHLVYTGFRGGLEHLKIETRLRDESLESVKGECVICVGVTKDYTSHIHWVVWGTGTPNDRDDLNRREV